MSSIKKENTENAIDVQDNTGQINSPYIVEKMRQAPAAKAAIAKHINKKYIQNLDAILLDAGSTVEKVAEELFLDKSFLTIMTNNIRVLWAYDRTLAKKNRNDEPHNFELQIPGGSYDPAYEALFGRNTIEAIQGFTPNVTIIGLSGLKFDHGVFCHGLLDSEVKKILWSKPTETRIIAAHWDKIGTVDAYAFGSSVEQLLDDTELAIVVTNEPIAPKGSKKDIELFEKKHDKFLQEKAKMERAGIIVDLVKISSPSAP